MIAALLAVWPAAAGADTIRVTLGGPPVTGETTTVTASGTVDREESVGVDVFVFPGHDRPCPTGHRDEHPYFEDQHEQVMISSATGPGPYELSGSWTPAADGKYRLCGLVHSLEDQRQGYATDVVDVEVSSKADIVVTDVSPEGEVGDGDTFDYVSNVTNNGPGRATEVEFEDVIAGNGKAVSVAATQGSCQLTSDESVRCQLGDLELGQSVQVTTTVRAKNMEPDAGVEAEDPDPFAPKAGSDAAPVAASQSSWRQLASPIAFASATRGSHVKHRTRGRGRQDDPDPSNNQAGKAKRVQLCESSVTIGPVKVASTCFRFDKKKKIWVSKPQVRMNGIDVGGARILVDPGSGKLWSQGKLSIRLKDVRVFHGKVILQLKGRKVKVPAGALAKLKGLKLSDAVHWSWSPGYGASVLVNATLPKVLGSAKAAVKLTATMAAGVKLDSLKISKKHLKVAKKLRLEDFEISYTGGENRWRGEVIALLPAPRAPEVKAKVELTGSKLTRLALDATFRSPGYPMSAGAFLQRIGADVKPSPFSFTGNMALTAGPKILGKSVASISGKLKFKPPVYKLSGNLEIVGGTLSGNGYVKYTSSGGVDLAGKLGFSRFGVGFQGSLKGWITGASAFNMQGKATIALPGPNVKGNGLVSSRGVAACGKTRVFGKKLRLGFGYRWGKKKADILGSSCDLGSWRASRSRHARGAAITRTVTLPRGLPVAAFAIVGANGPPAVTVTGPGGIRVETPADPAAHVETARTLLFRNPADNTTYVAVANPPAGAWTVTADGVVDVQTANGLPPVSVRAKVSGKRVRRVTWSATRIRGQRIQFFDRAGTSSKLVKETTAARGRAAFRPQGAGKHRIVAVVIQDDLVRATVPVASYTVRRGGRRR